jgi:hypothetical protein
VLVRGGREGAAFAATSVTVAAVVVSLFAELYPRVMVSSLGAANDLTAQNTASASYSLTVMTVVLAVLLPVVLAYQAWTYHVFRGRLRGPRVGGEPGQAIPAPRRTPAAEGVPPSSDLAEDVGSRAAPAGEARSGAGGRHSAGTSPMLRLATGGLVVLVAWLLLRQVHLTRAAPH